MKRSIRSHLPLSPIAISSPATRAAARMSKRHGNCAEAGPSHSGGPPGNARNAVTPGSSTTESRGRRAANRKASAPFTQRSKLDTAKTAMNRTAFVAKTVQKTPTYPIVENHAQSITRAMARPNAASETTIAAIATPIRPQDMFCPPPRIPRGGHPASLPSCLSRRRMLPGHARSRFEMYQRHTA